MKARDLLEAAGATILLLFPYFFQLFLPQHLRIYHHDLALTTVVRGLLLDMLGVFGLGCALILVVTHLSSRPRRIVSACLAGIVIWRFLEVSMWLQAEVLSSKAVERQKILGTASGFLAFWAWAVHPLKFVIPLSLALFAVWIPAISRAVVRGARLGLAGIAFSALWIIPTLSWLAFATHSSSVSASGSVSTESRKHPDQRVIWILFDELSYDLAFEHKPSGLPLPQLEKLHSTSVSFGNLEPIGYFTERVIPSLLLGQPMDQIRSDLDGKLSYMDQAQHRWLSYDADKTLFGVANANGWNSGVSGWYNPYCRLFASVLTSCFWEQAIDVDLPQELKGASSSKSSLENALVFPRDFLSKFARQATDGKAVYERYLKDYQGVMTGASALIQNDRVDFIFLHFPVPHPPAFYDRKTHQHSEAGDYLDGLVLADDTLGELIREIDRTPSADRTTVIVSSDHSWRVPLWRAAPGWTKEEEQISQGHFDQRPVFLVHFPGETSGYEVRAPLTEMVEHDIIASVLKGEMKTPEELDAFLQSSPQQVAHTD